MYILCVYAQLSNEALHIGITHCIPSTAFDQRCIQIIPGHHQGLTLSCGVGGTSPDTEQVSVCTYSASSVFMLFRIFLRIVHSFCIMCDCMYTFSPWICYFNMLNDLNNYILNYMNICNYVYNYIMYRNDVYSFPYVHHRVILRTIRNFSVSLRSKFFDEKYFNLKLCHLFFTLSMSFITQGSLKVEELSDFKKYKRLLRYVEMVISESTYAL